jgi:hypothetical protein
MASTSGLAPVAAAVLGVLRADAALLARVPGDRIVDEVPPRPTYPYLLVESAGERAFNTLGPADGAKWGSTATVRTRLVSQYRGDQEAADILGLVRAALDGRRLTVTGYSGPITADFQFATMLRDAVNGVVTRELLSEFEVVVHQ